MIPKQDFQNYFDRINRINYDENMLNSYQLTFLTL